MTDGFDGSFAASLQTGGCFQIADHERDFGVRYSAVAHGIGQREVQERQERHHQERVEPPARQTLRDLGRRGHAKATYARRHATNFVEDFVSLQNGVTTIPLVGTVTNRVYDNTDDLYRDYQAAIFESNYRFGSALRVDGHYTLQLRNHGNFAGEAANQPGNAESFHDYPEMIHMALDRYQPYGRLNEIIYGLAFTTHPYRNPTIGSMADWLRWSLTGVAIV